MIRWLGRIAFLVAVAILGLVLFNASAFAPTPTGTLKLIAHRGVAQQFSRVGVDNDTCTASRIEPPIHDRLENTARSIEDAVGQGADIVEVDIAPTSDGRIALFHDWTVDCRTDGKGATRDLTMAELQSLDAGHGYTADGGKTFPLRGQRRYPIPTLEEGLRASRGKPLAFNFKGKDPAEADLLAAALKAADRRVEAIGDSFYGDPAVVARALTHFPRAWGWSKDGAKACTKGYMVKGWLGIMPEACKGGTFIVPLNYQLLVPGWPDRALARFKAAGTRVIVTGPRGKESMAGIDLPEQLGDIPKSFKGHVWVEDIWNVGPALRPNRDMRTNAELTAANKALEARRAARD